MLQLLKSLFSLWFVVRFTISVGRPLQRPRGDRRIIIENCHGHKCARGAIIISAREGDLTGKQAALGIESTFWLEQERFVAELRSLVEFPLPELDRRLCLQAA